MKSFLLLLCSIGLLPHARSQTPAENIKKLLDFFEAAFTTLAKLYDLEFLLNTYTVDADNHIKGGGIDLFKLNGGNYLSISYDGPQANSAKDITYEQSERLGPVTYETRKTSPFLGMFHINNTVDLGITKYDFRVSSSVLSAMHSISTEALKNDNLECNLNGRQFTTFSASPTFSSIFVVLSENSTIEFKHVYYAISSSGNTSQTIGFTIITSGEEFEAYVFYIMLAAENFNSTDVEGVKNTLNRAETLVENALNAACFVLQGNDTHYVSTPCVHGHIGIDPATEAIACRCDPGWIGTLCDKPLGSTVC